MVLNSPPYGNNPINIARRVKHFAIDLFGVKKFAKRGDYKVSSHYKNGKVQRRLVSQEIFFKYYVSQ